MFELTSEPIVPHPTPSDTQAGGWVSFEGKVRSVNEGKTVVKLEYEIYAPIAINEGKRIVAEAQEKFGLLHVYGIHRYGILMPGETAIWVYAGAMHRREAFAGAEHIIHSIKHHLPIWKKEWYDDGSSEWVNCNHQELA